MFISKDEIAGRMHRRVADKVRYKHSHAYNEAMQPNTAFFSLILQQLMKRRFKVDVDISFQSLPLH